MFEYSFNLTGHWTSPMSRNWQSTWGNRLQPRSWSQLWRDYGWSDELRWDSHRYIWTEWFQYLQPEPQADSESRSVLSSTWRSTTLAKDTSVKPVWYLHMLLHTNTCLMIPAWFHSTRRRVHTRCQQTLPCHLFLRTLWKEASTDHTRHCPESGFSTNRSTPGGRVKTKSSLL